MGLKLVYSSSDKTILLASRIRPTLQLIQGEKESIPQLWSGDAQKVPLPKIPSVRFRCGRCGESEEFYVLSEHRIYCYTCSLETIQRHDVSKES